MEFSQDLRAGVLAGEITLSFRLWKRPKVRVGARYPVGDDHIEIDSIGQIPFGSVSAADVRCSGDIDREALRARTAHAGPISDETLVFRITFHVVR